MRNVALLEAGDVGNPGRSAPDMAETKTGIGAEAPLPCETVSSQDTCGARAVDRLSGGLRLLSS